MKQVSKTLAIRQQGTVIPEGNTQEEPCSCLILLQKPRQSLPCSLCYGTRLGKVHRAEWVESGTLRVLHVSWGLHLNYLASSSCARMRENYQASKESPQRVRGNHVWKQHLFPPGSLENAMVHGAWDRREESASQQEWAQF